MTPAKIEALKALAIGPCYTAKNTLGPGKGRDYGVIGGRVAQCLVNDGLARFVRGYQVGIPGSTVVEITEGGKAELALVEHGGS